MPLSDAQIRNAKPKDKPYKLTDGGGLFLLVTPAGGKLWRLKYRIGGKEKLLSLGQYPAVPLAGDPKTGTDGARDKANEARKKIGAGLDPAAIKKQEKRATAALVADSFESVAREWLALKSPGWSENYVAGTLTTLEKDLFPYLARRQLSEITPPDILEICQRIEARGTLVTAHRARSIVGYVFNHGIATGRVTSNPARDLKDALQKHTPEHYAAVVDKAELGALLRNIEAYPGGLVVRSALRLLPMLFTRPSELRLAEWTEVNLDDGMLFCPGHKMKKRRDHYVPLPRQAVEILRELQTLTGGNRYIFPNAKGGNTAMSGGALVSALRRMGYQQSEITAHGFRATAQTLITENLKYAPEVIERQLAHKVPGPLADTYQRAQYMNERRRMMQEWADFLDRIRDGAQIVPLRFSNA